MTREITWTQIENHCREFATKLINEKKTYDNIYPIPRGGLIPGVILSHALGIPMGLPEKGDMTKKILVIDEINDTGETLNRTLELLNKSYNLNNIEVYAIYKRHNSKLKTTHYSEEIDNDEWLVFPWESE